MSGMSVGSLCVFLINHSLGSRDKRFVDDTLPTSIFVVYVMLLAFMWEPVEFYLEAGYTHIDRITNWFQGVEFWGNRLITDPGLTVAGALLQRKYKINVWYARAFTLLWMIVNICVFPNSMWLQTWLQQQLAF